MHLVTALNVVPKPRIGMLQQFGAAMRRHAGAIQFIQWTVVLCYAVLIVTPAFLPLPPQGATIVGNLTLFAQFLFWGIWWPFVMVSMMLVGRVWCGVFCPEGALTEFVSRHGMGKAIPRWLRWRGWPMFAFIMTTVYGQLISVYEYPKAVLLILGGSTAAAMGIGFVYGKGKRVWCRYLCPANGVFGLLAKIAPFQFRVNEQAWKQFPARSANVNCAPLVDMRHMRSASQCHACGRCSGHRDAIALVARPPNREILSTRPQDVSTPEALLLIFGLLGVAIGAFQWTASPWFVMMKTAAAEWLLEREWLLLLQDNAPWWLLTHYPEAADVFTWLDGLCILAYIGGVTLALGGTTLLSVFAASRIVDPASEKLDWKVLAMGLVPLAGLGAFLGLSMLTVTHLRSEGMTFLWIDEVRTALLALALGWSAWLGTQLLWSRAMSRLRGAAAIALYAIPLAAVGTAWYLVFFAW
jgi:polyferredoxin